MKQKLSALFFKYVHGTPLENNFSSKQIAKILYKAGLIKLFYLNDKEKFRVTSCLDKASYFSYKLKETPERVIKLLTQHNR